MNSFKFKEYLLNSNPKIRAMLNMPYTVNTDYEVPYLGGISNDGSVVYITKEFNSIMPDGTDVIPFLVEHERIERILNIAYPELNYEQCHYVATSIELEEVKNAGIDVVEYNRFYRIPIILALEESSGKSPVDLWKKPYEDEQDCYRYRNLGI